MFLGSLRVEEDQKPQLPGTCQPALSSQEKYQNRDCPCPPKKRAGQRSNQQPLQQPTSPRSVGFSRCCSFLASPLWEPGAHRAEVHGVQQETHQLLLSLWLPFGVAVVAVVVAVVVLVVVVAVVSPDM